MKHTFTFISVIIGGASAAILSLFPPSSLTAKDIKECPAIFPHLPPSGVHDLRPDDIKVIAALGDSVTAGMLAKNIDTPYMSLPQFVEHRGASWVMGGDKDANSLANYFSHYSPNLYGASKGSKPARLCPVTFFCFDSHHDPEIDVLNAAQSGATSGQLPEQVDYLVERIGLKTPYATTYKMINVFIGFNDASISCLSPDSVMNYRSNVTSSLQKLIKSVDYAFINLVGIMHYNDLIHLTDKLPGYKKNFQFYRINMLDYECYCCGKDKAGTVYIGDRVVEFNKVLEEIAEELSGSLLNDIVGPIFGEKKKNVAVVFQPLNPQISTVPPNALSNMDGYHPNTVGYRYLSRALWNQMFRTKEEKIEHDVFDPDVPLYCPNANDRLRTYQKLL